MSNQDKHAELVCATTHAECADLNIRDATLPDGHRCRLPVLHFTGRAPLYCGPAARLYTPVCLQGRTVGVNPLLQLVCFVALGRLIRPQLDVPSLWEGEQRRSAPGGNEGWAPLPSVAGPSILISTCPRARRRRRGADARKHAAAAGVQQPRGLGGGARSVRARALHRPHRCGKREPPYASEGFLVTTYEVCLGTAACWRTPCFACTGSSVLRRRPGTCAA